MGWTPASEQQPCDGMQDAAARHCWTSGTRSEFTEPPAPRVRQLFYHETGNGSEG